MLLQYWAVWRLYTKSADEGFSLLCRHCRCTPWPYWACMARTHCPGGTEGRQAPGAGTHSSVDRQCRHRCTCLRDSHSFFPGAWDWWLCEKLQCYTIVPLPWTTAGNDLVKASVEMWEESSIALWNPHLQQHDSFSLDCERTWLLSQTLRKCWKILSDCQHPLMLSLWSWHLGNTSKSKKQDWFFPPAERACLNWNPTSRPSEVVSGVHKQSPCQCKSTSNMCNPSGTPSCTYKGLVVMVESCS